MGKYRKSIAAALALLGVTATAASDLSFTGSEISALVLGLLGVYAVWKTRNDPLV